jgi:hypothetical protein
MDCCEQSHNDELICYCFNITKDAFLHALSENKGKTLMDFVIYQTKNNYCNCEQLNPSKSCCLKDFKRLIKVSENN